MGLLLMTFALAVMSVWVFPPAPPSAAAGRAGAGTAPGELGPDGRPAAPRGPRAVVRGRLLLEPIPADEQGDEPGTPAPRASDPASDEPASGDPDQATGTGAADEDDGADALEGELVAPLPERCRYAAWQSGRRVGFGRGCELDGSFELRLEPGVHGEVAVEMEVSDRLRAVLVAQVPAPPVDAAEDVELPPVTLEPVAVGLGYPVGGQVTDARGDPVPHVIVEARPTPDLDEPEPWRTETDDDGHFLFDTLPEGPVALRVAHRGYDVSVVETFAPTDEVLVVVSELIDLEGRAVAGGEDLSRARVRIEGSSLWPPVQFPVAADGTFDLERMPDGVYGLEVVLRREDGSALASLPTENVTPDLKLDMALIDAYDVPVEVVDPGERPVPGARVRLGYASVGMLHKLAEADQGGQTMVGPVVPGPYVVTADATGFLPAVPVEIDVPYGGFAPDTPPVRLVLARPATLEGKVIDEHGQPVENAEVAIASDELFVAGEGEARARLFGAQIGSEFGGKSGGESAKTGPATGSLGVTRGKVPDIPLPGEMDEAPGMGVVLTDETGVFRVEGLVPGAYELRARHGDHAGSAPLRLGLGSGETRRGVILELREGALLTGRVLDGNGRPVETALISFEDGLSVFTDGSGSFDAGYHRGKVPLVVRADGFAPRRVVVPLGTWPRDVEVTLEAADGRVEGRLVDGNGRPVADAAVLLRPRDGLSAARVVETDAKGVFTADRLPRGELDVEVEHPDYVGVTFRARASPELGLLEEHELLEGWSLSVEVVDAATGDPVGKAEVRLDGTGVVADRAGKARLENLAPPTMAGRGKPARVEVRASGYVPRMLEITAAEAEPGAQVSRRLELELGGGMRGVITDDIGDEVKGAKVRVHARLAGDRVGTLLAETSTDAEGAWSVDGLPEGDVWVVVEPPKQLAAIVGSAREASDVRAAEVTPGVDVRFDRL